MKNRSQQGKQEKPWGRNRIPTAPLGHRHESGKDYKRQKALDIEDEWWDELEEWEQNLPIEGAGDD